VVNLLVTATVEQVAAAGAAAEQVRRKASTAAGADTEPRVSETFADNGSVDSAACQVGRASGFATLHRHGPIGSHLLAYLACAATLTKVLLDKQGAPLDVGRVHRLATPAQRKALAARDGGCVIPACPVPHEGTDAHHIVPWEQGGATDLTNLASACPRHHQEIHAGLWLVEMHDGIPWVRPPAWIDPERRWMRNLHHHTRTAARRIGQQLRLALDDDADARGVGPSRTGLTPIDLEPPIWNQAPPDDTWKRTG
jgi:hypothetical protein